MRALEKFLLSRCKANMSNSKFWIYGKIANSDKVITINGIDEVHKFRGLEFDRIFIDELAPMPKDEIYNYFKKRLMKPTIKKAKKKAVKKITVEQRLRKEVEQYAKRIEECRERESYLEAKVEDKKARIDFLETVIEQKKQNYDGVVAIKEREIDRLMTILGWEINPDVIMEERRTQR